MNDTSRLDWPSALSPVLHPASGTWMVGKIENHTARPLTREEVHSLIEDFGGEIGRLGCPTCGHAPDHKMDGPFTVCTIDGVVRWSRTVHGGVQGGFDFMFDEDDQAAPCAAGYCE